MNQLKNKQSILNAWCLTISVKQTFYIITAKWWTGDVINSPDITTECNHVCGVPDNCFGQKSLQIIIS
jgi:hypothetical protein